MSPRKTKTARSVAIAALDQFYQRPAYERLDGILDKLMCLTEEKQRASDLVFGFVRNQFVIDMVVAKFSDCPVERIQVGLLNIIRVAAYELIYRPATAEYAIVNEAVENTRETAGRKQAGFVNAVLRQITRNIENRQTALCEAAPQRVVPQTVAAGCEFDTDILPDAAVSPADYLSCAFSLPKWLIEGWLGEFGAEQTRRICFASNRRPSIYVRANTLKTSAADLAKMLRRNGIDAEIACETSMIRTKSPSTITKLPGFAEGLFTVQDPAASLPVRLLQPQPHWRVLDLCAAPGTKTTQLAELTGDKAEIIATDIDPARLKMVRENINRLGINSVKVVRYEQLDRAAGEFGPFDCVLLDVPCSNTAVLSRRPEVRLRINPKAIEKLTELQCELLNFAADTVTSGGKICYSTCSIQSCENSRVVKHFLRSKPAFRLESERLTLPSAEGFDHDGGYFATIKSE